jgi:hypothetical protein
LIKAQAFSLTASDDLSSSALKLMLSMTVLHKSMILLVNFWWAWESAGFFSTIWAIKPNMAL